MASQNGHHDIYIVEAGGGYRVRPAVWSTNGKNNPKLKMRNLTDKHVQVLLPAMITASNTDERIDLIPRRTTATTGSDCRDVDLKGLNDAEPPISCSYLVVVFTGSGAVTASGESEPIIIIDPPPA